MAAFPTGQCFAAKTPRQAPLCMSVGLGSRFSQVCPSPPPSLTCESVLVIRRNCVFWAPGVASSCAKILLELLFLRHYQGEGRDIGFGLKMSVGTGTGGKEELLGSIGRCAGKKKKCRKPHGRCCQTMLCGEGGEKCSQNTFLSFLFLAATGYPQVLC